ncbi:uncharacterized protein LOC120339446 isoform X2 [Styela clava]
MYETEFTAEELTALEVSSTEKELHHERLGNTDWCFCSHCSEQSNPASCICCHEAPAVKRVLERLATQHGIEVQCIVDHPGFEPICLNVFVLEATYQRSGAKSVQLQMSKFMLRLNMFICHFFRSYWLYFFRRNRYTSYRSFVEWCWGRVGRKIRFPLPSCVVVKIREHFESPSYTGFQPPSP